MHGLTDKEILDIALRHCEFTPESTYHLRRYPGKWAIIMVVREALDLQAKRTVSSKDYSHDP